MRPELVPLDRLHPAAWNANRVSAATLRKIRHSIEEFGFVENLVARPHPGGGGPDELEVLSGNHRLEILREMGYAEAPVVVVDLDDAHARVLAQVLNRTRGKDDPIAKQRLLEEVLLSLTAEEVASFLPEAPSKLEQILMNASLVEDPDAVPEPPAEPDSKPGKVYELGEHRLICGDATSAEQLETLLAGEQVHCVMTDPPYGVDYGSKNDFLNKGDRGGRITRDIENDALSAKKLEQLLSAALAGACAHAIPGGAIYVWYSHAQEHAFKSSLVSSGWRYAQTLVWVKNHHVMGRQDYQWKHEPILYGWKPGAAHRWFGDHAQTSLLDDDIDLGELSKHQLVRLVEQLRTRENTDVLRAAKPTASELHPTQKPVWLLEHMIANSTRRGEIVLDPFAGSGSTLIACEMLGRRARIVEIDPAYCDVIRQRYAQLVGGLHATR